MQGWPGGPPSLSRLNTIYSEGEEVAGRSKASSSGYGSQRGSGGGSVSDRPPPPLPLRPSDKEQRLAIWHGDSSEDPYTIYSTCSGRDEPEEHFTPAKHHSYSTIGRGEGYFRRAKYGGSEYNFKHSRFLTKVVQQQQHGGRSNAEYFKDNKGFISDGEVSEAVYDSNGYISNNTGVKIIEDVYQKIKEQHKNNDEGNARISDEFNSLQADPFLLYSQFIEQEEAKSQRRTKAKDASDKCKPGDNCDLVERGDGLIVSENNKGSLSVAREDYLRALLQDVAVALEGALSSRRSEAHGGLLQEARERVALGLVALRRAGPEELSQLSRALAKGPPIPLPRPSTPPVPSPHSHKPSLWYQYYMKSNSLRSDDSINICFAGDVRPEAQFTLGVAGERRLAGRLAAARKARCICRLLAATSALFFFLLALVLCSLLLSGGRAMFGSMMR